MKINLVNPVGYFNSNAINIRLIPGRQELSRSLAVAELCVSLVASWPFAEWTACVDNIADSTAHMLLPARPSSQRPLSLEQTKTDVNNNYIFHCCINILQAKAKAYTAENSEH